MGQRQSDLAVMGQGQSDQVAMRQGQRYQAMRRRGQSNQAALPTKPRVVVGIDFGTTYSGFAFAHVSNPSMIYTFYDYPKNAGEKPYCKTLTACYYKPLATAESSMGANPEASWKLQSWGHPARTDYEHDIQALHKYQQAQKLNKIAGAGSSADTSQHGESDGMAPPIPQAPSVGVFLSRFKLHLASMNTEAPLPPGLTVARVITDYLRELGELILKLLQSKYGPHFTSEIVQWCITVPSIWNNSAKATMKTCMAAAGLVSTHNPVTIVLEPEAASFHCQKVMGEVVLEAGNKLLVADIGGGTSDIVVQEVVEPGCRVKEVTVSSGGLCGGTYVDSRFMEFLEGRVGKACVSECLLHRNVYGQLMKEWECTKSIFDLGQSVTVINLPNKLAIEWERSDMESGHPESRDYGELEISLAEMQSIFDPIVEQNVDLIQRQMAEAGGKVQVLAMVGGFSESPYLLRRMREVFGATIEIIICPPNPGSSICQGAVAAALNPNGIVSRICKRTYGFNICGLFEKGIDPIENLFTNPYNGKQLCRKRFLVLVKKGDVVEMDEEAATVIAQIDNNPYKNFQINLFSCEDMLPPRYVTDMMQEEGKLVLDISGDMKRKDLRRVEVSLSFGGSSLEVKARALNFNAKQVQLPIKVDYLLH